MIVALPGLFSYPFLERSVKTLLGDLNRFYVTQPSPVVMPWYTQVICLVRVRVSNSLVQHHREHKNETNTEMKQR